MKERGILFNGAMVRALLSGAKTQTRRVVKPQPESMPDDVLRVRGDNGWWWPCAAGKTMVQMREMPSLCPYGAPGDRLWVRERFWVWWDVRHCGSVFPSGVVYAEDGAEMPVPPERYDAFRMHEQERRFPELQHHRPSIHMPRWASRITLEVTEVRVQRLQDISGGDVIAEGIDPKPHECGCETCRQTSILCPASESSLVMAYRELWDSINGKRAPWSSNPWAWAISLRRVP